MSTNLKNRLMHLLKEDTDINQKIECLLTLYDQMKKCPRCKEYKIKDELNSQQSYCKECSRQYYKIYAQNIVKNKIVKQCEPMPDDKKDNDELIEDIVIKNNVDIVDDVIKNKKNIILKKTSKKNKKDKKGN